MQFNKTGAIALIIGSGFAIGCHSNKTAEPQTNTTVTVKANQSARIGQDVTLSVTSIQDSRCPINAVCVRAGNADVAFSVEKGNDHQTGSLCLGECNQGVKDKTTIQLGGTTYQVILSEVRPFPGSSNDKPEAVIQLVK